MRPVVGNGKAILSGGLWVFPDSKAPNRDRRIIVILRGSTVSPIYQRGKPVQKRMIVNEATLKVREDTSTE
jgi:hypothetical protein